MYLPQHFKMPESELYDFIDAWSFGTLISVQAGSITANQVPFLVDPSQGCLYCHLAKANPQANQLTDAQDLLVSFTGPYGYVSPRWYQTGGLVPTWNYSEVQVQGRAVVISDTDRARWVVETLTRKHEAAFAEPWQVSAVPDAALRAMLDAIVCFRIDVLSLQGKVKLSQNRAPADQSGVIEGLKSLGGKGGELAQSMEARRMLDGTVPGND